jgi:hypothetical protein
MAQQGQIVCAASVHGMLSRMSSPYYECIRVFYAPLYAAAEGSVQQLMTHANQRRVACLIHDIKGHLRNVE